MVSLDLVDTIEQIPNDAFNLIEGIIENSSQLSIGAINSSSLKQENKLNAHETYFDDDLGNDLIKVPLEEAFLYTTYTYIKGRTVIGVIVIYSTYEKEFRTILTTRYKNNDLDLIGYVKTLEYAEECNAHSVKIYTDNQMPNLINNNIINEWLALGCTVDGTVMPMKSYIYKIRDYDMNFKKIPMTKKLNIENNKLLLLLKNIAVKIALNQMVKIKGDSFLKVRRMELDVDIARLSTYIFSKPIVVFENNDIDFE
ncbi:hypothetical protein [Clostridium tertium]|uniref:hypothetical protein n=1 Tax=Clostridium tertium TaxID=1559 RepID=UPI0023B24DE7|nr:hypothetical protein [Clostridium tertium]